MAVNTQTIRIDLNPGRSIPVAYSHQGDTARSFVFEVYNNGEAFPLAGYTAKIAAMLPADNGYRVIAGDNMADGAISENTITATLPADFTAKPGRGVLTIVLTGSWATIRPINVDLRIQKSADAPETIAGASDFAPVLERYMAEDMQTYINAWLDAHPEAMQYYISGSKLVLDENGILSIQNDTDEIVEALDLDTLRSEVSDLKSDLSDLANNNYLSPVLVWTNGQIKTDGTIGTSSSYKHTQAIPVKAGNLVEWQVFAGTSSGYALYATSDGNADYIVSLEEGALNRGLLEVPSGINYIRLSSFATATDSAYLKIYATSEELFEKTSDFFEGTGIRKGYLLKYGYIKNDGSIVSNGGYRYTLPIPVNSGEKYSVTTQSSSATFAIALHDSNGIVVEESTVGNDALTTYTVDISDGIIALSVTCARSQINNISIVKRGITLEDLTPSETIDNKTVNLLIKKYATVAQAEHRCATINFQFDDGNIKDADIVNIFKGKNAVCGFSLVSNLGSGRVSEYLGYQADGFEILSHSTDSDGMSDGTIPSATIEGKLKDSKKVLTGYGFNVRGWVTPRSAMASVFIPLLSKYYDFSYTQYFGEYTGTGTPYFTKTVDLKMLSRVSVQGTTLANMKLAVDEAIANNGFLTFYGHSANLDTTDNETTENLNALLDYINQKQEDLQCVLLAPSDAVDFYFHVRHEDYLELLEN